MRVNGVNGQAHRGKSMQGSVMYGWDVGKDMGGEAGTADMP